MHPHPLAEVIDLVDPSTQLLANATLEEARAAVASGDTAAVAALVGDFALVGVDDLVGFDDSVAPATGGRRGVRRARLARSLSRPLRFFLAKAKDGPALLVAERIDAIARELHRRGWGAQFHPSYTRMVPAHHVLTIELVGCPDPSPRAERFFTPPRDAFPADVPALGRRYVEAALAEVGGFLGQIGRSEPIGVAFSGGIDSGLVLLLLEHALLSRGESPARLKAFTLSVDGRGADAAQAAAFLSRLSREHYLEVIEVPADALSPADAVRVTEDYKPLDVQAATMALALGRGLRARYPDWRLLADGEGGDENFKDYPLEAAGEVTIRSVLGNPLLYHEGWGVNAVKHSQTYSGGLSRGITRSYATARAAGLLPFSPLARPAVVAAAEGIPFVELTAWDPARLYALKGEIVAAGVREVLGLDMPVFPKRRFQDGAFGGEAPLPGSEGEYRVILHEAFR